MNRSQRLEPVARIAKSKEDVAVRLLVACQKRIDDCEAQLNSLRGFRAEYEQRLHAAAQAGMSSRVFHDFVSFITRLDKAIEQQQGVLGQLRAEYEARRQQWLAKRAKSQALSKVIEHYLAEEVRMESRREQIASDDRAQRNAPSGRPFNK